MLANLQDMDLQLEHFSSKNGMNRNAFRLNVCMCDTAKCLEGMCALRLQWASQWSAKQQRPTVLTAAG